MLLAVLVIVVAAGIARADPPAADDIVARYIEARGGMAHLQAIRTIIYRGVYREGGQVSDHAVMSLMRPYYKLVGDAEQPIGDFAEGYDGSAWEYYGDPGIVVRTVGAASAAGRHATSIDGPLVGYRERGWSVTVAGTEKIGDRDAYRLVVEMPDGFRQEEFIDTQSWLLIAERKAAPIHAYGSKVESEERIGDYREVAGVLFPFAHREVELATGRVLNEMTWKEIVINHDLDVARFSPPEWKRTPLQTFIAQLYEERDDATALMWSYRDFRNAHPDVDTEEGLEVVGYQSLKMGAVDGAVALLVANAAEHPRSAAAAFGLGRAYAAAKRLPEARVEFQKAVEIDPKHERARAALTAIDQDKQVAPAPPVP